MTPQKIKAAHSAVEKLNNAVMAVSKTDPTYPIEFGHGVKYTLEYSFRAVVDLFKTTGLVISNGEITPDQLNDNEMLVQVLLAGLHTHHPGMTEDILLALMKMRHKLYYTFCVAEALKPTQPDITDIFSSDTEKEEDEDPLAGTGISLTSGPTAEN